MFEREFARPQPGECVVAYIDPFWVLATMWQLLTLDNYVKIFEELLLDPKNYKDQVQWYTAFIVMSTLLLLLSLVFKNVISAIIVNEHTTTANDERWAEQQHENQKQLDMLQQEMMKELEADFAGFSETSLKVVEYRDTQW